MLREFILKSLSSGGADHTVEPSVVSDIFDAIPLQIVVKSLRDENFGEFLVWNKEAETVLGISSEQALGRTDKDFFPTEQAEFFAAQDRAVASSGKPVDIVAEPIMSQKSGLRTLRTVKTPIYGNDGKPVALLAVSEDITERKSTESDLRKALDFLSHVNSQLPGAVFQLAVDSQGKASFPYVSEGIRLVTEDAAEEIMSGVQNLLGRILPYDLPAFLAAVAASRREMAHCRQEFRVRTKSGRLRWALVNAAPQHQEEGTTIWHGFITDITAQKETSEALRRGEERLHIALEATRAAAWEIEIATGKIYLSPEWGQLFGYSPEYFPATFPEWLRFVHLEDTDALAVLAQIPEGYPTEDQIEFRHLCADGSHLWVLVSGKPVFDSLDEGLVRKVGTVLDVTERKGIELQVIEAKETAERASQAKGDFLAMMSHEIRTPLNAVLGFSELLSSTPLTGEQEDYLRTIQDNSSALLVILNDVLDYSKIESGKLDLHPVPCDVVRIMRSAVDFFRPQAAAKGLKLHSVSSGEFPSSLLCDSARLNQILYNLLSNAIKFTERGGIMVDFGAEATTTPGLKRIVLRVRDTGIGIALERHPSLFDPFYQADSTTRRRFGGTGLGLAIVRRLASLMGGNIQVESIPGKGTTFTLSFNLLEPDTAFLFEEDEQKRMSINLGNLLPKILVVEDNSTNRRLVRLFLRKLGYESDEAENGFEGVEKVQAQRYDVIFMDLEMPGMDGYEATRLIRHLPENGDAYIVALTAHALPEFRERSLQAGMNAYLSKPVRQADLKQTLSEALRP
ncbi:hypothetical protein BH09VER1_BH09VER1_20340 [soil metagenome]